MLEDSKRIAVNMANKLYDELNRLSEELWDWKALEGECEGEDKETASSIVNSMETQVFMLEKRIDQVESRLRY